MHHEIVCHNNARCDNRLQVYALFFVVFVVVFILCMAKIVSIVFLPMMSSNSNTHIFLSFLPFALKFYLLKIEFLCSLFNTARAANNQTHEYYSRLKLFPFFENCLLSDFFFRFLLANNYLSTDKHTHVVHTPTQLTIHLFIKHHRKCLSQFSLVRVFLPCTHSLICQVQPKFECFSPQCILVRQVLRF